jgi:hypothetical protein
VNTPSPIKPADHPETNGTPPWRYERKFVLHGRSVPEILALIRQHPAAFREVYPPRRINNIYLDTPSLHNYHDHVGGAAHRVKTRVRWYGPLRGPIGKPTLEQKLKRGLVSGKHSYPLPPLHLNGSIDPRELAASFDHAALPAPLRSRLHQMQPVLVNRYERHYLQSADGRFRLTVDGQLEFHGTRLTADGTADRHGHPELVIVELKFDARHAEAAAAVTNTFPFRLQRCSKYVLGIEYLHGAA